jgi:hypothetical protein
VTSLGPIKYRNLTKWANVKYRQMK